MAININAKTTGVGGLETSADNSGEINIQSGGSTVMSVTSSGVSVTGSFSQNGAVYSTQPSFRNRIINGNMVIDQRNAGASVTATTSVPYTLDRWLAYSAPTSKFTVQQNAGSVTPPAGFTNYLGAVSSSSYSLAATNVFVINQNIEGFNIADLAWGTASAKTVTLSFQVYSSLTGTFGGVLRNSADNRSYPFTYSIPSANTWTSISVTVPGDTSGTWLTNNGVGIRVSFGLGVGSTYSGTAGAWAGTLYQGAIGATSVVSTSGATFYITGVQLEVGSTATEFEHLPYDVELARCQRYFSTSYGTNPVGTNTWDGTFAGRNYDTSSRSENVVNIHYPVQMRALPTLTAYSKAGTIGKLVAGSTSVDASTTEIACSLLGSATIIRAVTGAAVGGTHWYQFHYTANAEL